MISMKDAKFRILDILSQEIGNPISINQLNEKIKSAHGSSHYPAVYSNIQEMAKGKILSIDKYGRSSVASLNFDSPLLVDSLSQVELIKKIHFLEERKDWQGLVLQIAEQLQGMVLIKSIMLVRPRTYAKLNRLEVFIIIHNTQDYLVKLKEIKKILGQLQHAHNIRIDNLVICEKDFQDLLGRNDTNLIKEALADKIILFHAMSFWLLIKEILGQGIRIKLGKKPIRLAKISDQDLVSNLTRFGYNEMGTKTVQDSNDDPIGIEYVIISILIKKENVRRLEAIPIILAKNNGRVNYDALMFLASKFNVLQQLYSVLKVLNALKPTKEVQSITKEIAGTISIKTDEGRQQHVIKLDLKDMKKKMRLYHAIK